MMMARGLLEAGAKVYVSSRKPAASEQAVHVLAEFGTVESVPADLSREDECIRLAHELGQREQQVHILVTNAGAAWGAPLADFPASAWDRGVPEFNNYSYSASKAAVHHLTRVLAKEFGPRQITVNAVAPGPFPSKMMAAILEESGDEIAATAPLGRTGRPDDMAGVAVYLAARASAWVTGAIIPVDGGIWTTA